jgi:hypothetical protein
MCSEAGLVGHVGGRGERLVDVCVSGGRWARVREFGIQFWASGCAAIHVSLHAQQGHI